MKGKIDTRKYASARTSNQKHSALPHRLKVKPYPVKRWTLETLLGCVEASKCRTLDIYTTIARAMEVNDHDKR